MKNYSKLWLLSCLVVAVTACQKDENAEHPSPGQTSAVAHTHNDHDHDHDHDHDYREAGAHVHGAGELTLVLDDKAFLVTFIIPAIDIAGFEHKPESVEEKQHLEHVVSLLSDYQQAFTVRAEGGCELQSADILSPLLEEESVSSHADFELNYVLECQTPEKLTQVSMTLFKQFPGLKTLQASWIKNDAQGAHTFTADKPELFF